MILKAQKKSIVYTTCIRTKQNGSHKEDKDENSRWRLAGNDYSIY